MSYLEFYPQSLNSYEQAWQQFDAIAKQADSTWFTTTKAVLARMATALNGSGNAIVQAYYTYTNTLAGVAIGTDDPMTNFYAPTSVSWGGPTTYVDVSARKTAELSALAAYAPFSLYYPTFQKALENACALIKNDELAYYDLLCLRSALLETATQYTQGAWLTNVYAVSQEQMQAVIDLPFEATAPYPIYTVTADDTLETLAANILGDTRRANEIVQTYNLYPPYITPTPQANTFYPGARIILPPTQQGVSEIFAYGMTWGIDTIINNSGLQEFDLAFDAASGIAEQAGVAALGTDLFIRFTQPNDDWADTELKDYGVTVGQNRIITAFFAAQSALGDYRVASAVPTQENVPTEKLTVGEVIITPKPINAVFATP